MRTITIRVEKTIQEDAYEPFKLSIESSFSVNKGTRKEINELIDIEYQALCDKQNELLNERLAE